MRGDQDHPFSHGYTCAKGRALPQMHHHPDRIERPLMRVDDELATDDLGRRASTTSRRGCAPIIDAHGPEAIGVFFGSGVGMDAAGYRMAEALHAAHRHAGAVQPAHHRRHRQGARVRPRGRLPGAQPHVDYDHATLVIYVGSNPVVSHGHTVGDARSGHRDPRALPSPRRGVGRRSAPHRDRAARHATISRRDPGPTTRCSPCLVRELLRDGADRDVLDAPHGRRRRARRRRSRRSRSSTRPGSPTSPRPTSTRCSPRCAAPAVWPIDTGTGRHHVGQCQRDAVARVGADDRDRFDEPPRRRMVPSRVRQPARGVRASRSRRPSGSFGPGPREPPGDAVVPRRVAVRRARRRDPRRQHPRGAQPRRPPRHRVPRRQRPRAGAARSLDVFATIEIIANDTTALSTHVLPTKDQLERADVTLWDFLSPRVAAQHTPAVVDPVGDRRSTWWVLAELGRRLGHELADTASGDDATDDAMLARIAARASVHLRRARRRTVGSRRRTNCRRRGSTTHVERLGGWRLAPAAARRPARRRSRSSPRRSCSCRAGRCRHLNSQFDYLGEPVEVIVHPDDAAARRHRRR